MNLSRPSLSVRSSMPIPQPLGQFGDTLNIAIVHQDRAGYKWAQEHCRHIKQVIGEQAVRIRDWSMEELGYVDPWCQSVEAASISDLIFVTAKAEQDIPIDVRFWFDALLTQRAARPGALVGLVSIRERDGFRPFHVQEYLRGVAEAGHLDFFLQERLVSTAPDLVLRARVRKRGPSKIASPQLRRPRLDLTRGTKALYWRRGFVRRF